MPRGDSLARQLSLIQLIESRRELEVDEAARVLDCSRRTVYRDFHVLERIGVPLYQDESRERVRWRLVDGYRHRLTLSLSFSEMLALTAGRELLAGLAGTLFHEAAVSALEKVRSALPPEVRARADAAGSRLSAEGGRGDLHAKNRLVEAVVRALDAQETVELAYRKPGERGASWRRVDPYHLHIQAGSLYLLGYCHERQGLRTFAVHRATEVRATGARFVRRADVDPAASLHGSFGPWNGRAETIRLRFSAEAAARAGERPAHPSQVMQWGADGRLDVELRAPVSPALVTWLLGWGAEVEILAPARLRERVRREHRRAAQAGSRRRAGEA